MIAIKKHAGKREEAAKFTSRISAKLKKISSSGGDHFFLGEIHEQIEAQNRTGKGDRFTEKVEVLLGGSPTLFHKPGG